MPRTPERSRGESTTEGIQLDDLPAGNEPTVAGELRLVDGELLAQDGTGLFNVREGERVKVSADDTTAGYLEEKLSAASPLSLTTKFPGGAEEREVSIDWVFGTEYQHDENLSLSETTSRSYVQKHRWTTTDLPAGGYFVSIQATLAGSKKQVAAQARIQLDDTTTIAEVASNAGTIVTYQGHVDLDGVHNFDVDWRLIAGSRSAGIRDVHCVLWRVE